MLRSTPAVFAVGDHYQIMIPVKRKCLVWVKIGDATYYDATCGVMNGLTKVHRVNIPMGVLNQAKEYTVCWRSLLWHRPYFTRTGHMEEITFSFCPVPETGARAYHIADAHNHVTGPIRAANAFGTINFLILNGDLLDYTSHPGKFANIYRLCQALTGGRIPVVFARGNHDMRGRYAEKFTEFAPCDADCTYYTFRLGNIWGVVLDCGEDKADDCPEYGYTIACHAYRREQTEFLSKIVTEGEYADSEIKTRLVICHIPFMQKEKPPFDIEREMYGEWTELIRGIEPHLIICGHTHKTEIQHPGGETDAYGQPCPVVIASGFDDKSYWTGCGLVFGEEKIELTFTDSAGKILSTATIFHKKGNES